MRATTTYHVTCPECESVTVVPDGSLTRRGDALDLCLRCASCDHTFVQAFPLRAAAVQVTGRSPSGYPWKMTWWLGGGSFWEAAWQVVRPLLVTALLYALGFLLVYGLLSLLFGW